LALSNKTLNEGNFKDLLKFRMQAGDSVLKQHLEEGARNAQYTSVRIKHKIIKICESIIANDLLFQKLMPPNVSQF